MQDRTPWLRLIGGGWLIAGIVALLCSVPALLPVPLAEMLSLSPFLPAQGISAALRISPWSQSAVCAGALFAVVAGWGLVRRYSWAQTVIVPAHLLLIVYAIVGLIAAYLLRDRSPVWRGGGPVVLVVLIVVNGTLAAFLSGVGATEALSWLPLQTSPVVPLRCEFCGSPLDPETNLCPECKTIPEIVRKHVSTVPPQAKLVSLAEDEEFWIEPGRKALIGRGLSGNDINLDNPTVSRHHAQVQYKGGHFTLTALRDSNGTFINDVLVRQRVLQDGDEVRFGRVRFRFKVVELERSGS